MDTLQAREDVTPEALAREVVDRIFGPGMVRAIWTETMINTDGESAVRLFLAMRPEDLKSTTGDQFLDNLAAMRRRFREAGLEPPALTSWETTDDPRASSCAQG